VITGLEQDNSVPFAVPARFLLTGSLALSLAWTSLALDPQLLLGSYAAPAALALVHTLTLGFATMILVGAMHQLVPVLLVTQLYSARLGTFSYLLLLGGTFGVIFGFATGYRVWLLILGGGLELFGILLFTYNLWRTARTATQRDAVSNAVLSAAVYLSFTVLLGLLIAMSRIVPGLARVLGYITPLHLSLGLFGAFFLAIAGAGHKLLAMFTLSHGVGQGRLRLISWLVHGALLLLLLNAIVGYPPRLLSLLLLGFAALLFGLDARTILSKRLRKRLEPPMLTYLFATIFLMLSAGLALFGQFPAAVVSLLGGFIPLAIAGMLVKISSFLAWQHRYAPRVGKASVPMLRDMTVNGLSYASLCGLGLGALGLTVSLLWSSLALATVSSLLAALGAWSLTLHVVWISFGQHPVSQHTAPSLKGRTA